MDKENLVKQYTNGELTVVWKPAQCIHSRICWQAITGLPEVFNPRVRPWIHMDGSTSERIAEQVKKCPSGALSFFYNHEQDKASSIQEPATTIEIIKGGPMVVYGTVRLKEADGKESIKENTTAFCRCGQSANKPYCDGTHAKVGFTG